jgi:hypothetical protein
MFKKLSLLTLTFLMGIGNVQQAQGIGIAIKATGAFASIMVPSWIYLGLFSKGILQESSLFNRFYGWFDPYHALVNAHELNNGDLARRALQNTTSKETQKMVRALRFSLHKWNIGLIQTLLANNIHPSQLYIPVGGCDDAGQVELLRQESLFWATHTTCPLDGSCTDNTQEYKQHYKTLQDNEKLLGCLRTNKYTKAIVTYTANPGKENSPGTGLERK